MFARASGRLFGVVLLLGGGCSDRADGGRPLPDPSDAGVDARVHDGSVVRDSGSDAGTCAATGEECASTPCCGDRICVDDDALGLIVCAAPCSSPSDCVSGCCVGLSSSSASVCAPPTHCEPAPPPIPGGCADLVLVADDGTYLGDATSNEYATDGVCNEYSSYGSAYSSTSIFNDSGTYGSEYSLESAYNASTWTPPFLYCVTTDEVWNPVTKNDLLDEAIDPDLLCRALAENGY